ncbi:hypothetical protein CMI39_02435 [Candidatus Pacearchaeota archaeon]|jgi:hypothetical protein|nr:hypothetical protein [Candidatus Pacearchaeota archaeon]|tara:strand:- start:153 stop:1064 length:912 start_codon:yes stop_codon:yes gene_type:complete
MGWAKFFSFFFILFIISLLVFYWFIPIKTIEFGIISKNSNFNVNASINGTMQFYDNMRYPDSKISYNIYDCPLQKEYNMKRAIEILSNETILEFYSTDSNEEISITCDSKNKIEKGLFIAGEGGPTNITKTKRFNVISHGSILLLRKTLCPKPNVEIHELLHVLGFDHSSNIKNIMYNLSRCNQEIGNDTIKLIDELYSTPGYSDLSFENISAVMHGKYLDLNISVRNNGLKDSEESIVIVSANNKIIKEINLDSIKIGSGRLITFSNIWVPKINIKELELFINSSFNEIEKENNQIILEIKK